MNSTIHNWANTILIVIVGLLVLVGGTQSAFQGTTQGYEDARQGFRVNGTEVISSSRGATFASSTVEAFTEGGCVFATSTSAETNTLTLTAGEIQNCRRWVITPGRDNQSLLFTATSSITGLVPNSGDTARITVLNATGTAATTLRLVAAAGWLFQFASSTPAASIASTTPGDSMILTLIRKADTDIEVLINSFK